MPSGRVWKDCTNSAGGKEGGSREEYKDTKHRERKKLGRVKGRKRVEEANEEYERERKTVDNNAYKKANLVKGREKFRQTEKKPEKNEEWVATVKLVIALWRWFDL